MKLWTVSRETFWSIKNVRRQERFTVAKKTKIILGVIVVILALIVFIPAIGLGADLLIAQIRFSKPANYYAEAWEIAFPETAKEMYSKKSDGRDWDSYSVYKAEPDDDTAFTDYVNGVLPSDDQENITEILDSVQVPDSQRPDWECTYEWKHFGENVSLVLPGEYMDNLYVLYNRQDNTVYTIISHR